MTGLHWICWFCWGAGHIYEFPNPWVLNVFPCVYVFSFIKVLHFSVYVSSSSLVVYSKVSYSFWYYCNFHFLLNFFFRKLINSIKMQLTFLMLILCSATLKHFYKVCRVFYYKSCHLQIEMTGLLIDQFCPLILTNTFGTILNIMASLLVSNFRKKSFWFLIWL